MIIIALVLLTPIAALAASALAIWTFAKLARYHRRRRRVHVLTDREVADALAPFGADISIWPSRAPRNGTTHDPV